MPSSWDDWATGVESYKSRVQAEEEERLRRNQELVASVVIDHFLADDPAARQTVKEMLGLVSPHPTLSIWGL